MNLLHDYISLIYSRFYENGIIQYVLFCAWLPWSRMFLRLSMQKHVSALPSLILLRSSPLCGYTKFHLLIHLLKDICIVSSFWLLWWRQLWTTFCISLRTDICFQYSGLIPTGGITGFCIVYVYFIRLSKCSPKWLPFYILTGNV